MRLIRPMPASSLNEFFNLLKYRTCVFELVIPNILFHLVPIKNFRENLYDPEIFDCDSDANPATENSLSAKRPSWDLQNSFDTSPSSSSHPSKRKKTKAVVHPKNISRDSSSSVQPKTIDLSPYPEFQESKVRGCLKNAGNHPGSSIQNLLRSKWSPPDDMVNQSSKGKGKASSNNFGFKLHPFLAKVWLYF